MKKAKFILKKGPRKGIWGGLWSFAECSENKAEIQEKIIIHNPKAKIVESLTTFKNALSHFTLWINPIIVSSPGSTDNYYKTNNITLGVPAPVKKIIHTLDLTNHR